VEIRRDWWRQVEFVEFVEFVGFVEFVETRDWWRYGGDAVQVQMASEDQKLKAKMQNDKSSSKFKRQLIPLALALSRQGRENDWMRLPRASPSQRLRRIAAPRQVGARNDKE